MADQLLWASELEEIVKLCRGLGIAMLWLLKPKLLSQASQAAWLYFPEWLVRFELVD